MTSKIAFLSYMYFSCSAKSHADTKGKAQNEMKDHWVKNEGKQRPISPHLTIWKYV